MRGRTVAGYEEENEGGRLIVQRGNSGVVDRSYRYRHLAYLAPDHEVPCSRCTGAHESAVGLTVQAPIQRRFRICVQIFVGIVASLFLTASEVPAAPPERACGGDCSQNGEVTVDEVIGMTNIALGNMPVSSCPSGDTNSDGQVTVNEIISAVSNALKGCPNSPSATNTPTPIDTPTGTPTPTPTPTVGPVLKQGWIQGVTFGPRLVTYIEIDGKAIFEGDIVLDLIDPEAQALPSGAIRRDNAYRWPYGIVPYSLDHNLDQSMKSDINEAIDHWEKNTPIRFVQRTSANKQQYPDYVRFRFVNTHEGACSSCIGRQIGEQTIDLEQGCYTGDIIHEIGHAVGLYHEQSRADRDQFVRINWENIDPKFKSNFDQYLTDGDDVGPYDYGSIMHYGARDFSKNGMYTIVPLEEGISPGDLGQTKGLSMGDIQAVERIYETTPGEGWIVSYGGVNAWTLIGQSQFGVDRLGFGDFDGDGRTDVFLANDDVWYVSWGARSRWQKLASSNVTLGEIAFGDFDGDGRTDVFHATGSDWRVSWGGTSSWKKINGSGATIFTWPNGVNLHFGDFDGDGRTDVFRATGSEWRVSWGGTSSWKTINHSQYTDLGFGDFDGDGGTDAFRATGSEWWVSWGGESGWKSINSSQYTLKDLDFGDFDGDGRTDVFRATGSEWLVSWGGSTSWEKLASSGRSLEELALGDFDGDGKTDVFSWGG